MITTVSSLLLISPALSPQTQHEVIRAELFDMMASLQIKEDYTKGSWPLVYRKGLRSYWSRNRECRIGIQMSLSTSQRRAQESVASYLRVIPLFDAWTEISFTDNAVGEYGYFRKATHEGSIIMEIAASLGSGCVITTVSTIKGAQQPWSYESFSRIIEGAARRMLALHEGQTLAPLAAGSYRALSNVPRMISGGRTYIRVADWLSGRSISGNVDEIAGIVSFHRSGQTIRIPFGAKSIKRGTTTLTLSSALLRKNGAWWAPYAVLDNLIP